MPLNNTTTTFEEERQHLMDAYSQEATSYNALIIGLSGSGKTHVACTARRPIHFDMWDASGAVTPATAFRREMDTGEILVDARWAKEFLRDKRGKADGPRLFPEWTMEMDRRKADGYFDHIGTYVLDSATSLGEAIMNSVQIGEGKGFGVLSQPMWGRSMTVLENVMKELCALPCDVIITGHMEMIQTHNEEGIPIGRPYPIIISLGKKLSPRLPKTFSEVYHLERNHKG